MPEEASVTASLTFWFSISLLVELSHPLNLKLVRAVTWAGGVAAAGVGFATLVLANSKVENKNSMSIIEMVTYNGFPFSLLKSKRCTSCFASPI